MKKQELNPQEEQLKLIKTVNLNKMKIKNNKDQMKKK